MITALFTTSLPPNMHMHTARDLGRAYSAAIAIAIAASGTRTRTAATTTRLTTTQHRHHRKHATTTATATTTQSHEVRSRHLQGVHPLHLFRIVQDPCAAQVGYFERPSPMGGGPLRPSWWSALVLDLCSKRNTTRRSPLIHGS
jgi:hypothetical protein